MYISGWTVYSYLFLTKGRKCHNHDYYDLPKSNNMHFFQIWSALTYEAPNNWTPHSTFIFFGGFQKSNNYSVCACFRPAVIHINWEVHHQHMYTHTYTHHVRWDSPTSAYSTKLGAMPTVSTNNHQSPVATSTTHTRGHTHKHNPTRWSTLVSQ